MANVLGVMDSAARLVRVVGVRLRDQTGFDRQADEIAEARATVERMAKALEAVLPRLAHPTRCGKVLPAAEWAQRGSVSFEGCDCEIAEARAALAAYKGESHE